MGETSIEWTDRSINPIRARHRKTGAIGHYCELYSSGCAHCYSSAFQKRFHMPKFPGKGKPQPVTPDDRGCVQVSDDIEVFLDRDRLREVLKRRKPTKWFWCDMTDLFGWWVPKEWLDLIFGTMYEAQWHTHQVLTKRPERMLAYLTDEEVLAGMAHGAWAQLKARSPEKAAAVHWTEICRDMAMSYPFRNIWLGISCEDQQRADERIPWLLKTPAAVRFISAEPLLGPVDLEKLSTPGAREGLCYNALTTNDDRRYHEAPASIDWIIVGGESGHGARPCDLAWVRSIVGQCIRHGTACFVKQLGAHPYEHIHKAAAELLYPNGVPPGLEVSGSFYRHVEHQLRDKKGGDMTEWSEDLRVREFPK